MTPEQEKHMNENVMEFQKKYVPKYEAGQKAHTGNMWEMGAYQVLENAEEEVLDMWSYLRQIRKVLDEIRAICDDYIEYTVTADIKQILTRQKDDGEKK